MPLQQESKDPRITESHIDPVWGIVAHFVDKNGPGMVIGNPPDVFIIRPNLVDGITQVYGNTEIGHKRGIQFMEAMAAKMGLRN